MCAIVVHLHETKCTYSKSDNIFYHDAWALVGCLIISPWKVWLFHFQFEAVCFSKDRTWNDTKVATKKPPAGLLYIFECDHWGICHLQSVCKVFMFNNNGFKKLKVHVLVACTTYCEIGIVLSVYRYDDKTFTHWKGTICDQTENNWRALNKVQWW